MHKGTLLSLPGSSRTSRSNLSISRTSISASVVGTQEYGDELEIYLSLLAGKGDAETTTGKGKKQRAMVVNWSTILDHEEVQSSGEEEGGDDVTTEQNGDKVTALQFMKVKTTQSETHPKQEQKASEQSKGMECSTEMPEGLRKQPSQHPMQKDYSRKKLRPNTRLVRVHNDMNPAGSVSFTDLDTDTTTESGSEHNSEVQTGPFPRTPAHPSHHESRYVNSPNQVAYELGQIGDIRKESSSKNSALQQSRSSGENTSEQDTSDLSLSQELSTQFGNNILTLDQLEATNVVSPHTNTSTETNENPVEVAQLYQIHSIADLDSFPAESMSEVQSAVDEHLVSQVPKERDRTEEDSFSLSGGRDLDLCGGDMITGPGLNEESIHESISYEEDFENETVQSDPFTHDSRDDIKLEESNSSDNNSQREKTHTDSPSQLSHMSHHMTSEVTGDVMDNRGGYFGGTDSGTHMNGAEDKESDQQKCTQQLNGKGNIQNVHDHTHNYYYAQAFRYCRSTECNRDWPTREMPTTDHQSSLPTLSEHTYHQPPSLLPHFITTHHVMTG